MTKKEQIKKMLETVEGVINDGIDKNADGDMHPCELIQSTISTIMMVGSALVEQAMEKKPDMDIHEKLDLVDKYFLGLANELKKNDIGVEKKDDEPALDKGYMVDNKSKFDN